MLQQGSIFGAPVIYTDVYEYIRTKLTLWKNVKKYKVAFISLSTALDRWACYCSKDKNIIIVYIMQLNNSVSAFWRSGPYLRKYSSTYSSTAMRASLSCSSSLSGSAKYLSIESSSAMTVGLLRLVLTEPTSLIPMDGAKCSAFAANRKSRPNFSDLAAAEGGSPTSHDSNDRV